MALIVPAVLPKSRDDLELKLSSLIGLVEDVQVDIVDGAYAGPATWPYTLPAEERERSLDVPGSLPYLGSFTLEVDLIARAPDALTDLWIDAGAKRLTLHAEGVEDLERTLGNLEARFGHEKDFAPGLLSLGLALGVNADLGLLEPYASRVDYVQLMGISTVGRQGEPFDERVLAQVKALRSRYPDMLVQVDGGVSLATAPGLLEAGVSRLVVGSALWDAPDLPKELTKFRELVASFEG